MPLILLHSLSPHCFEPVWFCCDCNHCSHCALILCSSFVSLPCTTMLATTAAAAQSPSALLLLPILVWLQVLTTATSAQSCFGLLLFSLPGFAVGAGAGSKVKHSQARRVQAVLYECGPWANCPDGPACCQAASQQVTPNCCSRFCHVMPVGLTLVTKSWTA